MLSYMGQVLAILKVPSMLGFLSETFIALVIILESQTSQMSNGIIGLFENISSVEDPGDHIRGM